MKNKIKLNLLGEDEKQKLLELFRDVVKIPVCLKCGKLFGLGFPESEEAISDYLICEENDLLCFCENSQKVREKFDLKKDQSINISPYYSAAK